MIRRMSEKKRASLKGPVFSTISKRSESPRKRNPIATAKRKRGYRKMLSGKEYKAARAEAFERAYGRCEIWVAWTDFQTRGSATPFELTGTINATTTHVQRCPIALPSSLHAHHKRYPKGRKLTAADLTICCKPHHEYLESLKPHKTRMF